MKRIFFLIFYALMIGISFNTIAQVVDSLKRELQLKGVSHDKSYATNWYLFDSLFIVKERDYSKLIKSIKPVQTQLIYSAIDSATFYISTNRTVVINNSERAIKGIFMIIDEKCKQKDIKVVSGKFLKSEYGIDNPHGAFIIYCNKKD